MSEDTSSQTEGSADLLTDAEDAAKQEVSRWIRCTLRQTFLEALRQTMSIEPGNRISFSSEAFEDCIEMVKAVSQQWQDELKQVDHDTTADWIEEVYQKGKQFLWSEQMDMEEVETQDNSDPHDDNNSNDVLETKEKSDSNRQADDDNKQEEEKRAGADPRDGISEEPSNQSTFQVPYSALRTLGKRNSPNAPVLSHQEASKSLKIMGESGTSFWPLGWNLIEQVCEEIPTRFKAETNSSNVSYQVIPKSLVSKQEASGNNNAAADVSALTAEQFNSPATTILSSLIEGKRKKTEKAPRIRKLARKTEIARPPSEISASTHHVNQELTKDEKADLEDLIHPDELPEEARVLSVFGPLEKVGRTHIQLLGDNPMDDDSLTEKDQRRRYRARIQERIDPRRVAKNKDIQRFPSRVMRTEDRDDDTKKYFDLDLGWSLMEIRSGSDQKKKYCAFSSLEIVLEDQNQMQN